MSRDLFSTIISETVNIFCYKDVISVSVKARRLPKDF